MRKLILAVVVVVVVLPSLVVAQSSSQRLAWEQPGVSTLTEVQAYVYRLAVDTAPAAPLTPTCALVNTAVACSAPLPTLSAGRHDLTLTVENGFGSASAILSGQSPASPIKLTITISVTVP